MPELPEVQTIVNGVKSKIMNLKILQFKNSTNKLRYPIPKNLPLKVEGKKVINVQRRAKYIIINLSNSISLVIHLGMSGRIIILDNENKITFKHTHICINFTQKFTLQFIDPRKFGYIFVTKTESLSNNKFFKNLGVEPLGKELNASYIKKVTLKKNAPIKNILMNQKYIVGVGNIYASEALFMSGINPLKPGNDLTLYECNKLMRAIKNVLKKSIKLGGSSINDHTMISGKMGYFQNKLKVYGREGLKCTKRSCKSTIIRIVIAQRSTFYCKNCQK